ncbi:hypothetical protein ScalyP_jg4282 [Parmales sp. scaly parma]|nr:hypothetical protein ScalyP_jg4282 [Parmales sp. scaly parma]
MLVLLQFAGPAIAILMQFIKGGGGKGGVEGMVKANVGIIGAACDLRDSAGEMKAGIKELSGAFGRGGDIETPGGIEMRPMGGFDDSGDRLRTQSTGETGLGGEVVSKHEKYATRAAE